MAAFDALRTSDYWNIIDDRMTDVFRTAALRGRIIEVGGLVLLAALIVAVSYLEFGTLVANGHIVKAEVLRVGTHPVADVAGGDLPILTVRLPNASRTASRKLAE